VFQQAKYQDVLRREHVVTPLILEVFGGFTRHAQNLIYRLALMRESHFFPDPVAAIWGTPSFSAFHTQSICILLHSFSQQLLRRSLCTPTVPYVVFSSP